MHKITFFPVGNGDCCMIDLENGKKLLFDYANLKTDNKDDLRIDLKQALIDDLKSSGKKEFDVVSFSHGDDDHIHGAKDFFYFEHAQCYQSEERIKIKELWIPAAMFIEENPPEEVRILRAEARYRLKNKKGIKIFSSPKQIKSWIDKQEDLNIEECEEFFVRAGETVNTFNKENDGVEFFVHAPFIYQLENGVENRNDSSLIFQVVFSVDGQDTRLLLIGDTDDKVLSEIVDITRYYKREERLKWNIYDIPHHCSYKALNSASTNEGNSIEPIENVKFLLEKGEKRGILISCSNTIPGENTTQPPHKQAALYYKKVADNIDGEFKVTMEYPKPSKPEPIIINIDGSGASIKKLNFGNCSILTKTAPRAGRYNGR